VYRVAESADWLLEPVLNGPAPPSGHHRRV
jgi:hypothetical protein